MFDKKFDGAPFGTQKSRFDVAGIHPKSKIPGTFTQVGYDKKSMNSLSRKLGPGTYDFDNGSFSAKAVRTRASGPGWERAYITSQAAKMPHLLYREEWERKQMQKQLFGPGTYDIPDSFHELSTKPGSMRGVCATRAQRFSNYVSQTPGPGTYGDGGIPHSLLEEKERKAASTVGMLDAGSSGKRQLPEVGCALCPGQYDTKSFTDQLNERVVSKRGPYDLFTGERNRAITTGHFAEPARIHLGPGEYEIKSFLDELNDHHKTRHGRFSKVSRDPNMPSERLYNCTLSQWPRKTDEPGPGQYNPSELNKPEPSKRPPFGSSAGRMDKQARRFFMGNTNPVGPGRYSVRNPSGRSNTSGHGSAFNSNTKRWDPIRDKYLMERIRSKDVPLKDRVFLLPLSA